MTPFMWGVVLGASTTLAACSWATAKERGRTNWLAAAVAAAAFGSIWVVVGCVLFILKAVSR